MSSLSAARPSMMTKGLLYVFSLIIFSINLSDASPMKAKSKQDMVIDALLKNYAKNDPPLMTNATEVELRLTINSFYSISEATMDYMVSLLLRQRWKDTRLEFNATEVGGRDTMRLGEETWKKIWIPDTFFRNEKKANFHDVTVPIKMLSLNSDGILNYFTKISATFACQMQLQKYPMDRQFCPLIIESFGITNDTMFFTWMPETKDEKIIDVNSRQLPQFTLENYTKHDCTQNYTAGLYPCVEVRFILKRDIGFFLIQVYVPSILIVILSWVSFWINIESSPARVSIGLLTVLTTTTMSAGARTSLPRVSYIKAIDVWMIICLIFVFASLIEYALVNVMSRKKAVPKKTNGRQRSRAACNCIEKCELISSRAESDGKKKARNIDKLSRKCFPLSFIFFNIIYWTAYILQSSQEPAASS